VVPSPVPHLCTAWQAGLRAQPAGPRRAQGFAVGAVTHLPPDGVATKRQVLMDAQSTGLALSLQGSTWRLHLSATRQLRPAGRNTCL
jgi:hypothetical protein